MIILCKSCRCLTIKNLVIISRNLALTELQFLLLIGSNSKIFLSLQRTPRGTEGLRAVTGIFWFFLNIYIYIYIYIYKRLYSGDPSSKKSIIYSVKYSYSKIHGIKPTISREIGNILTSNRRILKQ